MIPYHNFVGLPDAPHLGLLLHGVLGAGHNLRSFAKRLVERRPEYRIALMDLRYHGKSLGAPPPHGLDPCVNDLFDLVDSWQRAPDVLLGHSLGGKVALTYAKRHEEPAAALNNRAPLPQYREALGQVWTLDSDPGAQQPDDFHEVETVMAALRAHPGPFESRAEAIAALMSEGRSSGLAQWLATSLDRIDGAFRWRYEIDQIEILLADYFARDEWPFLESMSRRAPGAGRIKYELLVAENSDRWSGSMKERASTLTGSHLVRVHSLPDSGHWVHVDNPDGLLDIVAEHLL